MAVRKIPIASISSGDNEGYLYAIDSVSGKKFLHSFQGFIKNQKNLFQ